MITITAIDFVPPYNEKRYIQRKGITTLSFKEYHKKSGIYLVKENGVIVYVGMSIYSLYKALYRHFYKYSDVNSKRRRVYYDVDSDNVYTVCAIEATKEDTPKLEKAFITALQPRDNVETGSKFEVLEKINTVPEGWEWSEDNKPF